MIQLLNQARSHNWWSNSVIRLLWPFISIYRTILPLIHIYNITWLFISDYKIILSSKGRSDIHYAKGLEEKILQNWGMVWLVFHPSRMLQTWGQGESFMFKQKKKKKNNSCAWTDQSDSIGPVLEGNWLRRICANVTLHKYQKVLAKPLRWRLLS